MLFHLQALVCQTESAVIQSPCWTTQGFTNTGEITENQLFR